MSETPWTPGPWWVGRNERSVVCNTEIPEWHTADSVEYYGGHLVAESMAPANARLIAAAPELAEALEKLLRKVDQFIEMPDGMSAAAGRALDEATDAARAALAKAKGETP
jgi:hypothetical protein